MDDDVRASDSFAEFLQLVGPGAQRREDPATFVAALERWLPRFHRGTPRADVLAALGPADVDEPGALAYRLRGVPGYLYRFDFDPATGGLARRGFVREGAAPATPPPDAAALAAIGATTAEAEAWFGAPDERRAWWPIERWRWQDGPEVVFRHGLATTGVVTPFRARHELACRSFQFGRPAAAVHIVDDTEAVLSAVAGLGAPRPELSRLLVEAALKRHPEAIALTLDARLRDLGQPGLSFAAVRASATQVQVSTAGDLRVHMIEGGAVTRVTRDHILANEMAGAALPAAMAQVVSRAVGGATPCDPETVVWTVEGAYRIVIASDEYHRFEPPEAYWGDLRDQLAAGRTPAPKDPDQASGLVVELIFS